VGPKETMLLDGGQGRSKGKGGEEIIGRESQWSGSGRRSREANGSFQCLGARGVCFARCPGQDRAAASSELRCAAGHSVQGFDEGEGGSPEPRPPSVVVERKQKRDQDQRERKVNLKMNVFVRARAET
jgi:hypothetical protein